MHCRAPAGARPAEPPPAAWAPAACSGAARSAADHTVAPGTEAQCFHNGEHRSEVGEGSSEEVHRPGYRSAEYNLCPLCPGDGELVYTPQELAMTSAQELVDGVVTILPKNSLTSAQTRQPMFGRSELTFVHCPPSPD